MDQIEVNIKLASNSKIYNLPIRKSDSILRLKEYCKVISNIPQDQQNLLYKGKILFDKKLISDYNIENNDDIILVKKEKIKSVNVPLNQNSNNLNLNENAFNFFKNIDFSNNKEVKINEVANAWSKVPDFFSLFGNLDLDLIDNISHSIGIGKFSEMFGIKPQEVKEILKDPSTKDMLNNMFKDPSIIETTLNNPILRGNFIKNPIFKLCFQNPQLMFNPQNIQMAQNMFSNIKKNPTENDDAENSAPPDPFGSLNNNQINQMMNSPEHMPSINNFSNNRFKENFKNSESSLAYKEEYKEQLSELRNMGFTDEEVNIQALKTSNGNIYRAVDKILEQNN